MQWRAAARCWSAGRSAISVSGRSRSFAREQLDGVQRLRRRVTAAAGRGRRGPVSPCTSPATLGGVDRARGPRPRRPGCRARRPRPARGWRWPSPCRASGCPRRSSRPRASSSGLATASMRAIASSWPGSQSMITGVGIAHHLGGSRVRTLPCRSPPSSSAPSSPRPLRPPRRAPRSRSRRARPPSPAPSTRAATPPTYQFEYGTSASYGLTTPAAGRGLRHRPTSPRGRRSRTSRNNTTYHYRLVATNAAGVARGSDKTFKTSAPAVGAVDLQRAPRRR